MESEVSSPGMVTLDQSPWPFSIPRRFQNTHNRKRRKKKPATLIGRYVRVRATSHTRLRARDHYISSTLIGGKGGAGPSSLHTTLEGPSGYVNERWMSSQHGFLNGIQRIMFHGHLDYFQKPSLGGRPKGHFTHKAESPWPLQTKSSHWLKGRRPWHKTGRPWHSEHLQPLIHFILSCVRTRMNRNSLK